MRFTAETRGCLKCKIASRLTWTGGRKYGRTPVRTISSEPKFLGCIEYQIFLPMVLRILGDPGTDSGGEGKSKRAGKYGTKKSKERRKEHLGTMSYQTSCTRSPPFWLLIGQKNTKVFWHQSAARTAVTVWNWSGKTLSPGALLVVLYFSSCPIFPPV